MNQRNHRQTVTLYINGVQHQVGPDHARLMLSDYLREVKRLTGTKIVCAEGDCGACSVLRLPPQFSKSPRARRFVSMNSCIATVAQMDGSSLVTVDALAEETPEGGTKLHPVQKCMMNAHASQCGFCTPGFVVALAGLVEKKLADGSRKGACSAREAMNATTGNLCRCTGYQPIVDAAIRVDLKECKPVYDRFVTREQRAKLDKIRKTPVLMENERFSFYAPVKLVDAVRYLRRNPSARLISAGTDLGVVHNKGKLELTRLVSLHLIPELYEVKATSKSIRVGARVSLSELRHAVKKPVPELARFLDLFASPQIKNVATLVGNLGNASPIADTPPFLLTAGAILHVAGPRGKRKLPLTEYYLGYRKTALKPGELIVAVEFEIPKKQEKLRLYKISQRKDLDISAVNLAIRTELKGKVLQKIQIALGGVAATPVRAPKTEAYLRGKRPSDPGVLREAANLLQTEIAPLDDLRGSAKFRRVLAENLFLKFFREEVPS